MSNLGKLLVLCWSLCYCMEDVGYGLYCRRRKSVVQKFKVDEWPWHVNIEGSSLAVRLLSQEQGDISNNITNDFF